MIVAIAGNAVENVVGITLAAKGQTDLAISVVKNSVAQIAVFLFPALVLLSLFFDERLTFVLNPVYIGALAIMALAVWQITGDGEAVVFEGLALVALYVDPGERSRSTSRASPAEPRPRRRELAPLARGEAVDAEARVDAPVQAADAVADRLAHPPHLALPALVQHELEAGRAEPADTRRRRARRPRARRPRRAGAAPSSFGSLPGLDLVDLLDAVARDARAGARAGRRS